MMLKFLYLDQDLTEQMLQALEVKSTIDPFRDNQDTFLYYIHYGKVDVYDVKLKSTICQLG